MFERDNAVIPNLIWDPCIHTMLWIRWPWNLKRVQDNDGIFEMNFSHRYLDNARSIQRRIGFSIPAVLGNSLGIPFWSALLRRDLGGRYLLVGL